MKAVILGLAVLATMKAGAEGGACAHSSDSFNCVQYVRNYDGDTFMANIPQVHPLIGQRVEVRVVGIDTPEMNSESACERQAAFKAQQKTEKMLREAKRIDLTKSKRDKYFRILADVRIDGESLADHLLQSGLAIPYDGGKKRPPNWCRR